MGRKERESGEGMGPKKFLVYFFPKVCYNIITLHGWAMPNELRLLRRNAFLISNMDEKAFGEGTG
jgi:hypothetical protein